jgi:hypothetical protein
MKIETPSGVSRLSTASKRLKTQKQISSSIEGVEELDGV